MVLIIGGGNCRWAAAEVRRWACGRGERGGGGGDKGG